MKTKRFRVSTEHSGRLRTVEVLVYPTIKAMRAALTRFGAEFGSKEVERKAVACAHSYSKEYFKKGRWHKMSVAGVIRFSANKISHAIIAHEATHIAINIYKSDVG